MSKDHGELMDAQDECLIAITDGGPFPWKHCRRLPPWRAVLIARVALKAGMVKPGAVEDLVEEARSVGGTGRLAESGGVSAP